MAEASLQNGRGGGDNTFHNKFRRNLAPLEREPSSNAQRRLADIRTQDGDLPSGGGTNGVQPHGQPRPSSGCDVPGERALA